MVKFTIKLVEGFLVTYSVQCKISGNNNGDNIRRLKERLFPIQYRQCMYNVTLRHICATTAAVEKQKVFHISSVCSQPSLSRTQSTSTLICCHLRSVWLYHIFPHYLIMAGFSEEMLLNIKYVP